MSCVRRPKGFDPRALGARLLGLWIVALMWGVAESVAQDDPGPTTGTVPAGDMRQERLMQRYQKMVQFNLDGDRTLPSSLIDSLMVEFSTLDLGQRIAAWADYFRKRGDAKYIFGLQPGGYAHEGRLVDDFGTDCILFFYRTTELGRSSNALEAVQFAFGTRFYGATLEEVVNEQGQVDYDSPVHLDYAVDMIRSGLWGKDATETLGPSEPDRAGSTRFEPDSVRYIPREKINFGVLRSGDGVFFVSDESTALGKKLRATGAIIGHVGILRVEDGQVYLIHPASKPLEGVYAGGKVEKVLLETYLKRVESFKGIMIVRIENF
ncbi:MAG: hypothetical protein KAY24_18770 [Candidatus Eisenbacteria sp.]|nr:hypothetical protein [Candidatus Eisenbacteria bacterium]